MRLSGYQEEAVSRLLEPHAPTPTFGVFDVPGSGKTAVAVNAHVQLDRFPALITVPAHLVLQWRDELIRWGVPQDEIGYCPRGMKPPERLAHLAADNLFQIVSYNMWTNVRYRDLLQHRSWQAYSFDEAHRLRKGRKGRSGIWAPVAQLRTKTRTTHLKTPLWLFTGTPIVKDASDVFPLCHLANPYRYSSRENFTTEFCKTTRTKYSLIVGPVRDREKFHALLGKYSIRRTWRDIPELRDLKRRDVEVPLELDPVDLRRHRTIKKEYRDPLTGEALFSSSAMIHALRRLTISTKVDALTEVVEDSAGQRFLIVCWYREHARMVFDSVKKIRSNVGYIDGGTSERERESSLRKYRDYSDGVLVGTIGALETGLNLQEGYNIVFVEQHWLSTTNDQAIARLLRRGQKQPVLVYWLHCIKTFDMRVKKVAETREANIERDLDEFLDDEEWT